MTENENCNSSCGSCGEGCGEGCSSDCGSCGQQEEPDFREAPHQMSNIKKVIGVVSGKGGVGKSLVTSLMAVLMNRRQYKTAILDADVTGPSIPMVFGVNERVVSNEWGLLPAKSKTGIEIMSVNLLLDNNTDPVVWRGPVIAGAVKQFWSDVIWADVDYMFVDMPPGTGDVPLTVFQSLPLDGVIIVTSPQELVSMIVGKAVNMAGMMNIPILGIVENMSYVECPDCHKKISVFGESHLEETAEKFNLEILGRLPIDPSLALSCDKGLIELFEGNWLDKAVEKIEGLMEK
ncbi:MAG: Mrp/NBP35 family ATP-binding protein [Clostridiales bacterium]